MFPAVSFAMFDKFGKLISFLTFSANDVDTIVTLYNQHIKKIIKILLNHP